MPFQISISHRQRLFTQVTLKSAGETQVHICTPTIYLEGIVEGELTGHTILWEQIGGSLVTLINGNTLTPHFDAVDSTDKYFRLWIDKGLPQEQYADTAILKTPTSFSSSAWIQKQSWVLSELLPQPVDGNDITAFVSVTVPPPTTINGEEPTSQIVVEVSWEHPTANTQFLPYIEQYKVIENALVVHDEPPVPIPDAGDRTGPPSGTRQYDGTFTNYRIDTFYNIAGKKFVRESVTKDFSSLPQPLVKGYNDNIHSGGFKIQNWLSRTNYSFINNQEGSDTTNAAFKSKQNWLVRTNFGFTSNSDGEDYSSAAFSSSTSHINITRYGGTGIGGG